MMEITNSVLSDSQATIIDFVIAEVKTKTIFIQKRADDRKLFPGCWELAGGHLEVGETIEECIRRELFEECGMSLEKIITKLHEFYWAYDDKKVKTED